MVKRHLFIALALTASVSAADKPYYQYPDAITIPDNSRFLMYDPATGSKNVTGATIKNLLSSTGPQGPQGVAGSNGAQGSAGAQGPQGIAGSNGAQGSAGPQGANGAQGPQGSDGTNGPQGANGAQGVAGAQGSVGAQGSAGPQGPQGDIGPQGPQGSSGSPDSQTDILNKLAISTDGAILVLTQGPTEADNSPRIQIKHRDGTVNVQINTDGTFFFNQGMFSYAP